MRKFATATILGISLLTPFATLQAQERPRHEWNASEDSSWRQYLQEHHRKYHDWSKAKKREQEEYWKWRDAHRDGHR